HTASLYPQALLGQPPDEPFQPPPAHREAHRSTPRARLKKSPKQKAEPGTTGLGFLAPVSRSLVTGRDFCYCASRSATFTMEILWIRPFFSRATKVSSASF